MAKLKKFFFWLADVLDDVLAYILTMIGILASNYLPLLKSMDSITVDVGIWKIILSAIIALMIVGKGEQLDGTVSEEKVKSKAGRKKRFLLRMSNALAQGVMWSQLINAAA